MDVCAQELPTRELRRTFDPSDLQRRVRDQPSPLQSETQSVESDADETDRDTEYSLACETERQRR